MVSSLLIMMEKPDRKIKRSLFSYFLSMEDKCISPVSSLSDPKCICKTLLDIYRAPSDASVDAYLGQYHSTKCFVNKSVMKFVNHIEDLENKLRAVSLIVSIGGKIVFFTVVFVVAKKNSKLLEVSNVQMKNCLEMWCGS